ncbi:MAG: hypothetical protein R2815_05265 [Flavobacteriales bacterium]
MNKRMHTGRVLMIPMALAALLLVQCSGGDGDTDAMQGDRAMEDRAPAANEPGTAESGHAVESGSGTSAGGSMQAEVGRVLDPTEERTNVSRDLRGLRATLVAELEVVRDRLNVGTQAEAQRTADQQRAAELAQGLERVDRALEAMGTATDETWSTMREAQLKEVDEVRVWLSKYRTERGTGTGTPS